MDLIDGFAKANNRRHVAGIKGSRAEKVEAGTFLCHHNNSFFNVLRIKLIDRNYNFQTEVDEVCNQVILNIRAISYDMIVRLVLMLNFYRFLVKDHYGSNQGQAQSDSEQQQIDK